MTFTICDSDLYSVYTLQVKIMGKGHEFIQILLSYSWYIINKIITRVVIVPPVSTKEKNQ